MHQERKIQSADENGQGGFKNVRRKSAPEGGLLKSLSGKLLILTIIFVMIAEVLIFVPSVANFRNVWLQNHLDTAEVASIVFLDNSDPMLSEDAQKQLLEATGSLAVAIRAGPISTLMATSDMPTEIDEHIDMTVMQPISSVRSALSMLISGEDHVYRVFGNMKSRDATIELVQSDTRLKQALRIYGRNVLLISLAISLITAALVILALYLIIVRPVRRISSNMTEFSREPDNAALILQPSGRLDEIGVAERRLAAFETDLHNTLRQRQHLADLGLAVSKINHDLRNILASAQLFSDRISKLPDPTVQRVAPKLLRSIDRAIDYTKSVLAYGKAVEAPPACRPHRLRAIADDVAELLGLDQSETIDWRNEVPEQLEVELDSEQMFRVMVNLCRNALQAMERDLPTDDSTVSRITMSAAVEDDQVKLRIADTGPGINDAALRQLFTAFGGSSKTGGTGLGLAIAAELVRAHGGEISVEETSSAGTVFLVKLPKKAPRRALPVQEAADLP
ncbi:MAG: HAMP domain-containing sensor histidine kinase [Pseudomonadota bacterium]